MVIWKGPTSPPPRVLWTPTGADIRLSWSQTTMTIENEVRHQRWNHFQFPVQAIVINIIIVIKFPYKLSCKEYPVNVVSCIGAEEVKAPTLDILKSWFAAFVLSCDFQYQCSPSTRSFSPMEVNMSRRARSDTKLESFQSELDDHNVLMYMYQHVFCKWMIMLVIKIWDFHPFNPKLLPLC